MKTAIVDTGGGLRGVYTAGVLDYCLDQGVSFDLAITLRNHRLDKQREKEEARA